jgi:hypothetical protein
MSFSTDIRRFYVNASAAVFCLAFAVSAEAQSDVKSVTTTGRAAGTGVKVKDEAKQDAKRNAVKEACGELINVQSQVQDFELKRDRILATAAGYLTDFKVTREWEENGISYCEIFATVSTGKFAVDWKALFEHLKEDVGNPRCVIVILEDNDTEDAKPPVVNGVCQSKMENYFLQHNVNLMDKGVSEGVRNRDVALAAANDDVAALAHRASEFKAEVLVLGRAEARYAGAVELGGRPLHKWDATLNVRVVQADSSQMLASNSYRLTKPVSSTTIGSGDEALVKLVEEVAPRVLYDTAEAWKKRTTAFQVVPVAFEGVSRTDFRKKIVPALLQLRGVQQGDEGVKLREAVNDIVTAEIYWGLDLNLLADSIEDLSVEGLAFAVKEQSGNRIVFKVIAKP